MQQKQNYRKDVAVVNISLLGFVPWINILKQNDSIRFSTPSNQYGNKFLEYSYFRALDGWPESKTVSLAGFLKMIREKKYPSSADDPSIATFPVKHIELIIDSEKFSKVSKQPGLGTNIECEIDKYILLSDLLMLDIINSNIYTRPVYFTSKQELFPGSL